MQHRVGLLTVAAGLLLIAAATLLPFPDQAAASLSTPLWCLVCGERGGVDVFNNILLFLPLGVGLTLLGVRTGKVVLTGCILSLVIESLQFLIIPGRDASLSDLVTNTMGSWVGALLGGQHQRLLWPDPTAARRLAVTAAILWWGIQAGAGALLRPWSPPGELTGAWVRRIPGRMPFDGTVVAAFVSGAPIPSDSTVADTALRSLILEGRIHLELSLIAGQATGSRSPVVELLGSEGSVLSVETSGRDLVVQLPARALALRLRPPSLLIDRALPAPGTELHLAAGERGDTLWAWSQSAERRVRAQQILSPSLGWSLLVPFRYAYGGEVPWLTGLWIAGWMIPIAYWSARSTRARLRWAWFLLVLLVGLAFVPHLMGYPAVPWWEWMAAGAGLGLGGAGYRRYVT